MTSPNPSSNRKNLLYLFDRPSLPIFTGKGIDATVSFEIPTNYYTDRYKSIKDQIQVRSPNSTIIPVNELPPSSLPDIRVAASLDRKAHFSVFNPHHQECATNLINAFMGAKNVDDLLSIAVYAQPRTNPYLYVYALTVAVLHRNDCRGLQLPSHVTRFPELYLNGTVLAEARSAAVLPQSYREPIEIPIDFTATDADPEHRLAYFREDIGLNTHHWHWHLLYPSDGPPSIINKDRRGEIFYYMHQQIIARYNFERLSNDLPRVGRFNFEDRIPEAYFPKMDSIIASRSWPGRQANARPSDINREADGQFIEIEDLNRWKSRIYDAISRGSVYRGSQDLVPLGETDGIDVLGCLLESNALSINRSFYGAFHNMGHNLLGFIHDPDNRFLESFATIGDNTTSLRDPLFYRWHNTINDVFEAYKGTLPPYTAQQLGFDGVQVTRLEVGDGLNPVNTLQTFWERDQFDLSRGVDFVPTGPIFVAYTHLQHVPFTYRISVQNNGAQRNASVRIFLAPKTDERGLPFRFRAQKSLFIELDRFTTNLRAGNNIIERRSSDSTLTIPFYQTFRDEDAIPLGSEDEAQNFIFCGCGWPDYLLLPKGTTEGLSCELFVMLNDYQQDRVEGVSFESAPDGCDGAFSFCGLRNQRYPDRKPMGFPFDRLPRAGVISLNQFLTPNMRTQDVRIRFVDKIFNGRTITETTQNRLGGNTATNANARPRPPSQNQKPTSNPTNRNPPSRRN